MDRGCMAERFTPNGEKVILTLAQSLFVQGVILCSETAKMNTF